LAAPKLRKAQREALITWLAEGLGTAEIKQKAAAFEVPFEVTPQGVDHYRKRHGIAIQRLIEEGEQRAMRSGLGKKAERVDTLKELAEVLKADLLGPDKLWLKRLRMLGHGESAQLVEYYEFNGAEIDALRGLLADIAKELGDRGTKHDHLLRIVDTSKLSDEQVDRLANGEDPIHVLFGS
jgi:hypothetical protein